MQIGLTTTMHRVACGRPGGGLLGTANGGHHAKAESLCTVSDSVAELVWVDQDISTQGSSWNNRSALWDTNHGASPGVTIVTYAAQHLS